MNTIRLGKTNLLVSRVAMGGIPLTRPDENEVTRIIRRALDLGINFIDTAYGYTTSEERIGRGIAGRRQEVYIATKTPFPDRQRAAESLDVSLQRLGTDYVDLWQFHGVNSHEELDLVLREGGAMEAALAARQAGKVRHIGFSSHTLDVAVRGVETGFFETVQFPFNYVEHDAADRLVPLAQKMDVGFIAMKPFAGGRLRNGRLALRYLMQYDWVVPDPGIEKMEELGEIVVVAEEGKARLCDAEWEEILALRRELSGLFCRQCGYCMPCPQEVIIPGLLYMKPLYTLWSPERFFTWRYVTDSAASAGNCLACGECVNKCPYHLPIPQLIQENLAFYRQVAADWEAR